MIQIASFAVNVETELGHTPQSQGEHRAILEACERGDAEQAAALMHDHVAQVGRAIIEYVRQRDESEATEEGTE